MSVDFDEDMLGPGSDLAISLSGILVVILVASFTLMIDRAAKATAYAQRLEVVMAEADEMQTTLQENQGIMAKLRDRITYLLNDSAETIRGLEAEMGGLLDEIVEREDAISGNRQALAEYEERIAQLTSSVKDQETELSESQSHIEALRDRNSELQDENYGKIRSLRYQIATQQKQNLALESQLENARESKREAEELINRLREGLSQAEAANNDRPPIITISDAEVYTFRSGSALLSSELRLKLRREIAPELHHLASQYGATIVEIIGHTDEVPVRTKARPSCNIDHDLLDVLNGNQDIGDLYACDNVGLGMARAVAVVLVLQTLGFDKESGFIIRPMSSGPATLIDESISPGSETPRSDPDRRRIEIRLRRDDSS